MTRFESVLRFGVESEAGRGSRGLPVSPNWPVGLRWLGRHGGPKACASRLVAGLLTMLLVALQPAMATPLAYDLSIRYVVNPDPVVFGSGASMTMVFDNGSTSRLHQIYLFDDIIGVTIASHGGSYFLGGSNPLSLNIFGDGSNVFASTDAIGRLAIEYFDVGNGIEFVDLETNNVAAAWAWSASHSVWISMKQPTTSPIEAKGLFYTPEPGSGALFAIALAAAVACHLLAGGKRYKTIQRQET